MSALPPQPSALFRTIDGILRLTTGRALEALMLLLANEDNNPLLTALKMSDSFNYLTYEQYLQVASTRPGAQVAIFNAKGEATFNAGEAANMLTVRRPILN